MLRLIVSLLLTTTLIACGGSEESPNEATELRDFAQSHTDKAELTARIAEAKMRLRLLETSEPNSAEIETLKQRITEWEDALKDVD